MMSTFFNSRLVFSLLMCILMSGCSTGPTRPVCQPVSGRVLFANNPVQEGQLTFHPVNGSVVPLPTAVTDKEGKFQVTTWADSDGLPQGDYVITIVWNKLVLQGEEKVRNGQNQLPAIYADSKRSPLRCSIKEGIHQLPAFELKR